MKQNEGDAALQYLSNLWNELDLTAIGQLALRLVSVFLCLTIHETCHGLAAYALGDPTAKRQHRLSLNPLHHIDWFGLAAMVLCGFGWAKPVPVDARYFKRPKTGMALTALAGPVSNLLLAALLLFCARFIYYGDTYTPAISALFDFLLSTAVLSIGLGVFNLVPLPPLDGSKVAAALLPNSLYVQWMRFEQIGMLLVFALVMLGVGDGILSRAIGAVYAFMIELIILR